MTLEVITVSKLSENLVYLRQRANMSQLELAEKSGCSRSAIGMYETGKREPDIETLEAFADIFNVDMDFLTGRSESNEWSVRFRAKLQSLWAEANKQDMAAVGIDARDIELVISGSSRLTFDFACEIVDAFGVSFDYMLGREQKKSIPVSEDGLDEINMEIISILASLKGSKRIEGLNYLRYLANSAEH